MLVDETGAVEMQRVRNFLALCEVQSFTRAAERCGITQRLPQLRWFGYSSLANLERD
jgi:hypothetical protein